MPSRSPNLAPLPPHIHMPRRPSPILHTRARSPGHVSRRGVSNPIRGRGQRRGFRPSASTRQSRSASPVLPPSKRGAKATSFTPVKRKPLPKSLREPNSASTSRKHSRSISPVIVSRGPAGGPSFPTAEIDTHSVRSGGSMSNRVRGSGYEDSQQSRSREGERPVFRGPESGKTLYDINQLKRITVDIRRNLTSSEPPPIQRAIINPEDIAPVRRPDRERVYGHGAGMDYREHHQPRSNKLESFHPRSSSWNDTAHHDFAHRSSVKVNSKQVFLSEPQPQIVNARTVWTPLSIDEGARPLFARDEFQSRVRTPPFDEERRVITTSPPRHNDRDRHSYDRDRYYAAERERSRSPYDRGSPPPTPSLHSRERDMRGERSAPPPTRHHGHGGSRDDLRQELEMRRRDEPSHRYSPSHRASYERIKESDSDLRMRLIEKRTDHSSRSHDERDREFRPSPPHRSETSQRSRGSIDASSHRRSGDHWDGDKTGRDKRGGGREREKDGHREGERRGTSAGSKKRDDAFTSKDYDYVPKHRSDSFQDEEFYSGPGMRGGRVGVPYHRGGPMIRGRGVFRGVGRGGFRPMGPPTPWVPRPPFRGHPRGFPPPRFFIPFRPPPFLPPPYF